MNNELKNWNVNYYDEKSLELRKIIIINNSYGVLCCEEEDSFQAMCSVFFFSGIEDNLKRHIFICARFALPFVSLCPVSILFLSPSSHCLPVQFSIVQASWLLSMQFHQTYGIR